MRKTFINNNPPLSEDDLALTQPEWADFAMENFFWSELEAIADRAQITPQDFIEAAVRSYPQLAKVGAVRLAITVYLRDQFLQHSPPPR